jgi:ribosomal protein S6
MNPMEEEKRPYEMNYLLRGDAGEEKAAETNGLVRKLIEDNGGLVTQENGLQKQNLSYSVKRQNAAYLGSLKFIFPPEKIQNLKNSLEKIGLLRVLLTQENQKKETARYPLRRRAIRRPAAKIYPPAEEGVKKEPAPVEERVESPLQVEEIDKKLEEILGE